MLPPQAGNLTFALEAAASLRADSPADYWFRLGLMLGLRF